MRYSATAILLVSVTLPITSNALSTATAGAKAYQTPSATIPFNNCKHNFYYGTAPSYTQAFTALKKDNYELCFNGFAVSYSGVSKTPLWSAEYLSTARLRQAANIDREDSFHIEERVAPHHRASLSDYKGSGFDRGHLAPNADMASKAEQHDSFSLANITPQDPKLNRNLWREVEYVTRGLVYKYNEAWIVTGVTFNTKKVQSLKGNVLVPSDQFKAVYIPSQNMAGAYFAPNNDSRVIEIISLDDLKIRTGLDAFPAVSPQIKAQVSQLPFPNYDDFESPDTKAYNSIPSTYSEDDNQALDNRDDIPAPAPAPAPAPDSDATSEPVSAEETKNILFKIISILKRIFSLLG